MLLAGVEVRPELVEWIRLLVAEPTATTLGEALEEGYSVVSLDIQDRTRILAVLDDAHPELAQLRVVLLRDLEGYRRAGLM